MECEDGSDEQSCGMCTIYIFFFQIYKVIIEYIFNMLLFV